MTSCIKIVSVRPLLVLMSWFLCLVICTDGLSAGKNRNSRKRRVTHHASVEESAWSCSRLLRKAIGTVLVGGAAVYAGFSYGVFDKDPQVQLQEKVIKEQGVEPAIIHLLHLPQAHPVSDREALRESGLLIIRSQGSLVVGIRAVKATSPDVPIFLEGLSTPADAETLEKLVAHLPAERWNDSDYIKGLGVEPNLVAAFVLAKKYFPEGIPQDLNAMTADQEGALATATGPLALWATGEVTEFLPVDRLETMERARELLEKHKQRFVWPHINREIRQKIMWDRETDAIANIAEHFHQHPDRRRTAILVFGAAHHFELYKNPWLRVRRFDEFDPRVRP